MSGTAADFLQKGSSRGLLVDTNLLVLLFVGATDRNQIAKFKRTVKYVDQDYETLVAILSRFDRLMTTPAVLAETSQLTRSIEWRDAGIRFQRVCARGRFIH